MLEQKNSYQSNLHDQLLQFNEEKSLG